MRVQTSVLMLQKQYKIWAVTKFESLVGSTFVGIEASFMKLLSLQLKDQDLLKYKSIHSWLIAYVTQVYNLRVFV